MCGDAGLHIKLSHVLRGGLCIQDSSHVQKLMWDAKDGDMMQADNSLC